MNRLLRLFARSLASRALVTIQNPVRLGDLSEPEPDVALVRPRPDDYASGHPGPRDVFLLIEVADTTVDFDREVKAPLYAAAGIPEYWLVDLPAGRIEVFREPADEGYLRVQEHGKSDALRPSAFPGLEVPVETVLP